MRISKALRRNSGIINHMFGGLDNIITTTNFNDVMDKFNEIENRQYEANKFSVINRKLFNTQLADDELLKTNESFNANQDYQNSKSYKDWNIMYPKAGQIQKSYQDYLRENKENYADDYKNAFVTSKVPLTEQELTARRFEKAGLTPEDAIFYSDYIKKRGGMPYDFNKELTNLVSVNRNSLRSRGSLGNTLLEDATNRAANLMEKTPKPIEWGIYTDGNKNVWQYDKNNPENKKLLSKFEEKPKEDKTKLATLKDISFKIDEEKDTEGNPTGKYYYYIPSEKDGQIIWEKTSLDATKKEYDSYISQFDIDETTGNPRRKSSSRSRSSVGFVLPKMPEEFKNITVDDVSKMSLSQLNTITNETNRKLVSEEVYNAAKNRLRGGSDPDNIEKETNDEQQTYSSNNKYKEGSVLSEKVRKVSEKIMSKKDKINDIQKQREEVANEFAIFKKAFNSKKYKLEDLNKSVMKYISDLEKAGYDESIIEEANQLFENFKSGL